MSGTNWQLSGEYMESCNCDYLCPCIFTNPQGEVTYDNCTAALIFRIDQGQSGSVTLDKVLINNNGLTIIGAGSKSQNPPDLLGSARMAALVEQLSEAYDYVVIDTPPVGPVIDARVAMQLADKIIYVVRWQSTTREMVAQTLETLDADRKLAGIVFNLVDETKTPRYGPYSYYAGYYYKKYYQG